jgi:predicted kinase
MECILFTGIQASGKSTFYQSRFADTHLRINLDMLRTRHREAVLVRTCLDIRQRFVVDNTNPTRADRARYIAPAREAGFSVVGYYFRTPLPDAMQRNAGREGKARVPNIAIAGTNKRLEVPDWSEGFDMLYVVRAADAGAFDVEPWPTSRP